MLPETYPIGAIIEERIRSVVQGFMAVGQQDDVFHLQGLLFEGDGLPLVTDETGETKTAVPLTAEEQNWIRQHPGFTVGVTSLDPYSFQEQGTSKGYLVDLLLAISQQAGLKPEFHFSTVDSALAKMRDGLLDVTMGLIHTPDRTSYLTFSEPAFPVLLMSFARNDRTDISDLHSLKGKKIASYEGYALNALFKNFLPESEVILAQDMKGMLRLVATGKADAAVQELHTGEYQLQKHLIIRIIFSHSF